MPKPAQVYLLEVSYPEGRFRNCPTGGIFRTEHDMGVRISTIKSKARRAKKRAELRISVIPDAKWMFVRDETIYP